MPATFCPRLSEARNLLPLLRSHLVAAASRYPLAGIVAVDLLPIVDDGLFGYELVLDPAPRFFLTLGCNEHGVPALRKTFYGAGAPNSLQLAALDGETVSRSATTVQRIRQRDTTFPDWSTVVESAWAQLAALFPHRPRHHVELDEAPQRILDGALSVAHSHLAAWDPCIRFGGLPNEAQDGFALHDACGNRGELISRQPSIWILRWKAPPDAVYEEWSLTPPAAAAAVGPARA